MTKAEGGEQRASEAESRNASLEARIATADAAAALAAEAHAGLLLKCESSCLFDTPQVSAPNDDLDRQPAFIWKSPVTETNVLYCPGTG